MLEVGDLVRVRGYDWIDLRFGIVVKIQDLTHRETNTEYTVVTAVIEEKEYTFSENDFELISKAERKEID